MDPERYGELLVRRALGELSDAERRELEREIERRGDEGCDEADRVREIVGSLGLAATPRKPPPALRRRILGALGHVDAEAPAVQPAERPRTQAGSHGRLWPWVAVVATVVTIGLGLYAVGLREDLQRTRARLQTVEGPAARVEVPRDSLAGMTADVSSLISSNAVTLSGTSPGVMGWARVFQTVDTGRTLLLLDELPVLPPDRVYQLWAIRDGQPTDAGSFRLEREGPAWIELAETTDLSEAHDLALTVEQAPGATAPTGAAILSGGT